MQERNGVAYCASGFEKNGRPPRVICAAPVFAAAAPEAEELPLREIFDHPDFVDLISAQEFGLEMTGSGPLLCIVAAQTPQSLREVLSLIAPAGELLPAANAREEDGKILLQSGQRQSSLPAASEPGAFSEAMRSQALSLPEVLAALTLWCTGYAVTLYMEETP